MNILDQLHKLISTFGEGQVKHFTEGKFILFLAKDTILISYNGEMVYNPQNLNVILCSVILYKSLSNLTYVDCEGHLIREDIIKSGETVSRLIRHALDLKSNKSTMFSLMFEDNSK